MPLILVAEKSFAKSCVMLRREANGLAKAFHAPSSSPDLLGSLLTFQRQSLSRQYERIVVAVHPLLPNHRHDRARRKDFNHWLLTAAAIQPEAGNKRRRCAGWGWPRWEDAEETWWALKQQEEAEKRRRGGRRRVGSFTVCVG